MSVKFWKSDSLSRVFVCRSGLPSTDLTGELGSISRLLSVVSTKADIVACSGCPVELIQTIDHNAFFPRAVQSCFCFEQLQLQKPTYSVLGRIDFFSVLTCLIVSLGAATGEDWVLQSPDLARGPAKLDLPSLPNLCRELVKHWKAVRQYLTTHTPHQGMQGVHNQVQSFEWSIICDFFFVAKLEFFQRIIGDCE